MNPSPASCIRRPFFFDGPADKLFAILFEPRGKWRGQVLFCPPFAEEMNKSRRMITLTSEQLAARGYASMVVDLTGTGDSAGNFVDARWDGWVADLERAIEELSQFSDAKTSLCGVRLGAGLALDLAARCPEKVDQLLYWQPVLSGKIHMTQFLRLKIAAQLTAPGPKTSTGELRDAAARGEIVEVAGYALHPELIAVIDSVDMRNTRPPTGKPIRWFEVVADESCAIAVGSRKLGQAWSDAGVDLEQRAVPGESFWATQEIGLSHALAMQTVNRIAAV